MGHLHFVYFEDMIYSDCNLLLLNESYMIVCTVLMLFLPIFFRCLWSLSRLQTILHILPIQGFKSPLTVRTCVCLFACVCMHVCQWVGVGKCINSMCVE